ncbi:conserved protein of unknown function [Streptomyces sp. KY70]|nr:conserved protein of unknown function [Streptomyces sp. KY70]
MHRPVLQQGQDRRTHITAPCPSPSSAPTPPASEGTTAERRPEGAEGFPAAVVAAPTVTTVMTGPEMPRSVLMLVLISV